MEVKKNNNNLYYFSFIKCNLRAVKCLVMQLYNYENQQNRTKILFYTIFMTLTIKQTFFLSTVFFVSLCVWKKNT